VSAGFRPAGLPLRHAWRLAAVAALAMLDAAHEVAVLAPGTIALKWPNDLVSADLGEEPRKVAGVLGETVVAAGGVGSAVVGIGVNTAWPPDAFPPDLASSMTSLAALARGRSIDRDALLRAWLAALETGYTALRAGTFDAGRWMAAQRTTGHRVRVVVGDGTIEGEAVGVDPEAGDLLVRVQDEPELRAIGSGEVVRCRIVPG
jgi:BirA family biotin operon repressor/biotin-[acetyl-CoA-carboxylase] ligase